MSDLQQRIQEAVSHPKNLGEMVDADSVGELYSGAEEEPLGGAGGGVRVRGGWGGGGRECAEFS